MGTFTGHLVPGVAFSLFGLWHTLNTISSSNSSVNAGFQSRTWHPLSGRLSFLRQFELVLLLSFSIFAMAAQLLFSQRADSFEHATIFFHIVVYSCAAIAADMYTAQNETLRGLINVLATNVFAQQLFLLRFHSTDHVGVEGHYHWLLQLLVFVCLISSSAAIMAPSCFPAALVRSMAVTLQGVWFIVMAYSLWEPRVIAAGCHLTGTNGDGGTHGAVICVTAKAEAWATVLANLQFSWAVGGVSTLTAGFCLRNGKNPAEYRRLVTGAPNVQNLDSTREEHLKPLKNLRAQSKDRDDGVV